MLRKQICISYAFFISYNVALKSTQHVCSPISGILADIPLNLYVFLSILYNMYSFFLNIIKKMRCKQSDSLLFAAHLYILALSVSHGFLRRSRSEDGINPSLRFVPLPFPAVL